MASAYMNSIKGNFSPLKKGEKQGSVGNKRVGGGNPPTRKNQEFKLSIGKR